MLGSSKIYCIETNIKVVNQFVFKNWCRFKNRISDSKTCLLCLLGRSTFQRFPNYIQMLNTTPAMTKLAELLVPI